MRSEPIKLDYDRLKFLSYLDKGIESSILLCTYNDKYLIGKLYHKA